MFEKGQHLLAFFYFLALRWVAAFFATRLALAILAFVFTPAFFLAVAFVFVLVLVLALALALAFGFWLWLLF